MEFWTFISLILSSISAFIFGAWCLYRGIILSNKVRRYEFEHRTSGGVLEFNSYDDSIRHNYQKAKAAWIGNGGILLSIVALIVFLLTLGHY